LSKGLTEREDLETSLLVSDTVSELWDALLETIELHGSPLR
jgi:hypothetical protein